MKHDVKQRVLWLQQLVDEGTASEEQFKLLKEMRKSPSVRRQMMRS